LKGAFFQSLVVDHQSPGFPVEQLDQGTAAVEENIDFPGKRIPVQGITYQTA